MNCRNIEQLLPLYVEGDLGTDEDSFVNIHLLSCAACRGLSEEYHRSQDLLRLHTPPEFDAAFYAGIRRTVLGEISDAGVARPVFASFFSNLFRAPLTYAASGALLLMVGALAFGLYYSSTTVDRPAGELAAALIVSTEGMRASPKTDQPPDAPAPVIISRRNSPKSHATKHAKAAHSSLPQRPRGVSTEQATPQVTAPHTEAADVSVANVMRASTEALDVFDSGIASTEVANAGLTESAPEMLRIELQTSDPNIRIIWLSPKNGKVQPSKTDVNYR
ncbi:MAG: zf-HC2 domain-containing protein [Acidobacteriota bacterium]|nr:zf-HC2 domain-containing protein [Acidobacteriota bacterium]